jgi:hypothetical protein
MLQNDRFEAFLDESVLPLYSENSEYVSIFSDNMMFFRRIVVKFAVICKI